MVGTILTPYFLSKPSTEAITTEAQSVSGMKPMRTSSFSGLSEPCGVDGALQAGHEARGAGGGGGLDEGSAAHEDLPCRSSGSWRVADVQVEKKRPHVVCPREAEFVRTSSSHRGASALTRRGDRGRSPLIFRTVATQVACQRFAWQPDRCCCAAPNCGVIARRVHAALCGATQTSRSATSTMRCATSASFMPRSIAVLRSRA